jgi:GR25 family glycosyltransferase involved in LPS biosynthesis
VENLTHDLFKKCADGRGTSIQYHHLKIMSEVARELRIRRIDSVIDSIGVPSTEACSFPDVSRHCRPLIDSSTNCTQFHQLEGLTVAMESAFSLGDGAAVLVIVKSLVLITNQDTTKVPQSLIRRFLDSFRIIAKVPVVRVINLERRKDRMSAFMTQALRTNFLVLKAIGDISKGQRNNQEGGEGYEYGGYALDGHGRMAEAQGRLVESVGSLTALNKLVAPEWRPNDLKAFDRGAPDHEGLVPITASERACALSHLSSWTGALRSLELMQPLQFDVSQSDGLFRHPEHMVRLFKISGFAEGPALLHQNECMPPAPVCVILEDDAMLVDRFAERLHALLKELPRDFHFCSLGYSRPKTAPIVPFTPLVGIPTMLWYLTGYIISEQGAKYLLNSCLPVVGPVDSWIGLKMTSNWDNLYGANMGVGVHAKPNSKLPSRKELCSILQFRAFCAVHPLCSQHVRGGSTNTREAARSASATRNWRHRDTDIEYSGDKMRLTTK